MAVVLFIVFAGVAFAGGNECTMVVASFVVFGNGFLYLCGKVLHQPIE